MPILTLYACCKCNFQGTAFKTWGSYYYSVGDQVISINRRMALCYGCNSITTAEVLPENDHPYYPDFEQRRQLLADRVSPARCLQCGSHDYEFIYKFIFSKFEARRKERSS